MFRKLTIKERFFFFLSITLMMSYGYQCYFNRQVQKDINLTLEDHNISVNKYVEMNDEKKILSDRYDTPGLRYGDIKKELLERIFNHFSPYRKKREYLLNNLDDVYQVLEKGREKANVVANEYIDKIRKAMGIAY